MATLTPTEMKNAATAATTTTATSTTGSDKASATVVQKTTPTVTRDPDVEQFNKLCDAFIAVKQGSKEPAKINGKIVSYTKRSISALGKIINFIWLHQDNTRVLTAYRTFMSKYYNTYLSDTEALQGINHLNSSIERDRISIMYMLMYEVVNPKREKLNYDYTRAGKICANPNNVNPNGFIQFIASRMK